MHLLRTLARGGVTPVTRRTIPIAAPAAGVGVTIKPQDGRAWEVLSLTTSLVADSNAANRAVTLALSDGTSTLWTIPPAVVQVASATCAYSWIAGYPTPVVTVVNASLAQPLPPVILLPDWSLTLGITNVQAADQLAACELQVIESFVGETEFELDLARSIERRADAIALAIHGEVSGA